MSGKTAARWLRLAKESGYKLKCYFLWVRDIETTFSRIQGRVTEGGHNIEAKVLRRRFFKTIQNFFGVYKPLFDSWKLFENDHESARLLVVEKNGRRAIRDDKAFERIKSEAMIAL
jgi:predicted ABC-type ATPase